ncbi:hypothetical protein JMJ77_0007177 [Colletotrichum scovillei]|uniref:Uncharacterized protein n=1 Tax=Colletotrichum scovillei TaxID=1209932 RepID=A0A9P7UG96_9PEZI|nr:hypothetical protein JMJ77_0007177 [Colletotrichum scovillei]KAG7074143.1 hypothetical protein JMJ76_0010630 [Colletotrichum scovillei]KAG7081347.1 hypothetical protein JMJ78_0003471 [Colletotrichum scovillei]
MGTPSLSTQKPYLPSSLVARIDSCEQQHLWIMETVCRHNAHIAQRFTWVPFGICHDLATSARPGGS